MKYRSHIADYKILGNFSEKAGPWVWAGVCAWVYNSYTNTVNMIVD
jgi:hypothetical protein